MSAGELLFYFEDVYFVALVEIVFQFGQIIFAKTICTCSFETCTSASEISKDYVQYMCLNVLLLVLCRVFMFCLL